MRNQELDAMSATPRPDRFALDVTAADLADCRRGAEDCAYTVALRRAYPGDWHVYDGFARFRTATTSIVYLLDDMRDVFAPATRPHTVHVRRYGGDAAAIVAA